MISRSTTIVLASVFAFFARRACADEPPEYYYSRRIEEVTVLAQQVALRGPYLFGIELQPSFPISLTAGDGEFVLSISPYRQQVSFVVH
jgi:hypothetical protein